MQQPRKLLLDMEPLLCMPYMQIRKQVAQLIYNDTQSDKAVAVIAFGGDKTVTSGTFTIQFPTADASNAILRIA